MGECRLPALSIADGTLTGAFCSIHGETRSTNARYISNTALSQIQSLKIGVVVSNLLFSSGIRTTRAYMHITMHIIASRRRRVTGALQDLSSSARCSMFLGRDRTGHYATTTQPTSLHMSELSRTRRVSFGTTSTTTIPRKRLATWD
jgi:hypothetical protein